MLLFVLWVEVFVYVCCVVGVLLGVLWWFDGVSGVVLWCLVFKCVGVVTVILCVLLVSDVVYDIGLRWFRFVFIYKRDVFGRR